MSRIINFRVALISFFILASTTLSACSECGTGGDSQGQFSPAAEQRIPGLDDTSQVLTPSSYPAASSRIVLPSGSNSSAYSSQTGIRPATSISSVEGTSELPIKPNLIPVETLHPTPVSDFTNTHKSTVFSTEMSADEGISETSKTDPLAAAQTLHLILEKGIVTIADIAWAIEVADTPETRRIGLSGRDSMPELSGMLFKFDQSISANFWMVGMKFPLDFVWISEHCAVSEVMSYAPTLATSERQFGVPTYQSSVPSKYTLEINAGEAARYNIQPGDKVRFEGIDYSGC